MLPELPVAGPSPGGPPCPSTTYLYHNTIEADAGHLLSRPNDALASQLGLALGSTNVDHIMLNAKNVSAFAQGGQPPTLSSNNHLQGALYRRDQTLFTPINRQQQHEVQLQAQRWNSNGGGSTAATSAGSSGSNMENYSPTYGHHSPASNISQQSGGYNQNMYNMSGYGQFAGYNSNQQQSGNHHMMANSASGGNQQQHVPQQQHHQQQQAAQQQQHHSGLSHGQHAQQSVSQQQIQPASTNGELVNSQQMNQRSSGQQQQQQHQQQQQMQHPPAQQQVPQQQHLHQQPMQQQQTQMNHVDQQEQQQPKKEVKDEIKPVVPSIMKNNVLKPNLILNKLTKEEEEMMQKSLKAFVKDNPKRAQDLGVTSRSRRSAMTNATNIKHSDGSESESDEDGDPNEPKKLRSKFFRATEKERNDEKSRAKEERRKRKLEDESNGVISLGKRRREHTPEPVEEEELKPFVPKKVTRKVERKLVIGLMKITQDDLGETGTFGRFNKTVDLIFENMEDINLKELEEASIANDGVIEIPPEIIIPKYQLKDLADETAKLKSMGATESVPVERLIKLLTVLELNIREGCKVVPLRKCY